MKQNPLPIDQELIKSILDYDPTSGEFRWINSGKKAGCTHKSSGYRHIKINSVTYQAHRIAWCYMNCDTPMSIDHINGDKSDNRIENLRVVTDSENQKNQKKYRTNNSGFTGVHWHSFSNKWRADITVNRKKKTIGYFDCKQDAIAARKIASVENGFHANHGK